MIKASQLSELIIKPALLDLVLYTDEALQLLMFTCAVESVGGAYLKQEKGPALGIFQMEPATYWDIWDNYIKNKLNLMLILGTTFNAHSVPPEERLIYDLRYATVMARIHYERVSAPLPVANDIDAIYEYYKLHYNTSEGLLRKTPPFKSIRLLFRDSGSKENSLRYSRSKSGRSNASRVLLNPRLTIQSECNCAVPCSFHTSQLFLFCAGLRFHPGLALGSL